MGLVLSAPPRTVPVAWWRRALDALILACALSLTGIGLWLSAGQLLVVRESAQYAGAPTCSRVADAVGGGACVIQVPATIDLASVVFNSDTVTHPQIVVDSVALGLRQLTLEIPRPSPAYYQLRAGQIVSLKLWKARVTGVYVTPDEALRTSASPYVEENLDVTAGLFALGMGVVVFLVHPPAVVAGWRTHATRWDPRAEPRGSVRSVLRSRAMALGLAALLILQILDVVTSVRDGTRGFFEANPLAAGLADAYGSLVAFIGIKVAATIALILGVTRLPRMIATIVVYAAVAVMVYVVSQNAVLYLVGSPN